MPWVLRGICTSVHPMGLSLEDIAHTLPEPRSQSKRRVRGAAALKLEGSTGMSWHGLRWKTCQRLVTPGSKINHTSSRDDSSKIVPWCTFIRRWTSEKGRGSRFHYIFRVIRNSFGFAGLIHDLVCELCLLKPGFCCWFFRSGVGGYFVYEVMHPSSVNKV